MTKGLSEKGTVSRLTADTTVSELIEAWPAARAVLARRGMACVGCAMAPFETIAEVAVAYGFDADDIIREVAAAGAGPMSRATLRRRKDPASRAGHHSRQRRSSS